MVLMVLFLHFNNSKVIQILLPWVKKESFFIFRNNLDHLKIEYLDKNSKFQKALIPPNSKNAQFLTFFAKKYKKCCIMIFENLVFYDF